jgi:peptide/nickel transport system permease protein
MTKFFLHRLAQAAPVLVGVSFIVFISVYLLPGDVTQQILGLAASKESIASLRGELGLDKPVIVQYFIWLGRALSGNLGDSHVMRAPVLDIVAGKAVNSLLLMGSSMLLVLIASPLLAACAAWKKDSLLDRAIVMVMFLLASLPTYWLGLVLIILLAVQIPLFPSAGMNDIANPGGIGDTLRHLILPTLTTAATSIAIVTRVTRSAVVDCLTSLYVTAARARGLSSSSILFRHAFRNALPTFITISSLQIGYLFGSAIFTEIVFAWPGIGLLLYNAIISRDGPLVQGCVLVVGLVFVIASLAADVLVRWLDVQRESEA